MTAPQQGTLKESDRVVWVLVAAVFLVMLGLTLVAPILPLYAREFGVSRSAAGVLVSSFAVARLIFDLAGGPIVDRVGARRVMSVGAGILAASSVAAAMAPTYGVLLGSRFLEGVGSAAFATAAMQYLVVAVPRERRARVIARYQTGLLAGIAVGPVVGGQAANLGDFRTPFWLYAVIGLVVGWVAWRYITEVPPTGQTLADTYRAAGRLLRRPAFLALLFVAFALFIMRAGARITILPLYAGEDLGLSAGDIGVILAAGAFANLFTVNAVGSLVDRIGRRPTLIAGLAINAVGVVWLGFLDTFASLLVLSLIWGLFQSLAAVPPPTLAGDLAPPGAEGASIALFRSAGDIGVIVGPPLLGAIVEGGNFAGGFITAGAVLAVAVLVALAIPETRHARTETLDRPVA